MGHIKGERLLQNRVLAGGFGGIFILAGLAMLVVGSMLYLAQYEEYKNEHFESAICYIEATDIIERQPTYTDYKMHFVLQVNVIFVSKDNNTHEGILEYRYYSDVAPAQKDADQLQRDDHINCYYSTTDYTPRLDKPPLDQYLAKGISIVATGIVALLGGLALFLYLVISIRKQQVSVAKIAKNTVTAITPVKSVGHSNH